MKVSTTNAKTQAKARRAKRFQAKANDKQRGHYNGFHN